jgi:cell division protease FtsH
VIFLVLLAWNAFALFGPSMDDTVDVPYSAFLAEAHRNNVATVTFNGQSLDGTFRQAIPDPQSSASSGASSAASPASSAGAASPVPAGSSATAQAPPTYISFTTVVPPLGDPTLLPLLESNGVTISAKDVSGGSGLLDLIISLLPAALIVGVILWRGSSGSAAVGLASTTPSSRASPSPTSPARTRPRPSWPRWSTS